MVTQVLKFLFFENTERDCLFLLDIYIFLFFAIILILNMFSQTFDFSFLCEVPKKNYLFKYL